MIIFIDDMGYGDLGCFGGTAARTPNIDRLAAEGVRFTSFYAQTVCGPSRGALMTGRYPIRIGGGWRTNAEEITVAEVLKEAGYATGCIGKWDMSNRRYQESLVPNAQGFDYYFGALGANVCDWSGKFGSDSHITSANLNNTARRTLQSSPKMRKHDRLRLPWTRHPMQHGRLMWLIAGERSLSR